MPIMPDTKDWTWVLERRCDECGFNAEDYPTSVFASTIRENAAAWVPFLIRKDVRTRRDADKWSDLEYACHVRDVYRIFNERLNLMLSDENPTFLNWDQDETALHDRYDLQDPAVVRDELLSAANALAESFENVGDSQWSRAGTRSNGSLFSVASLGSYGLHDPIHHLWDVSSS
ncbi:MAG TPA: DinB family protein [Acidimicrobiales bacterium]